MTEVGDKVLVVPTESGKKAIISVPSINIGDKTILLSQNQKNISLVLNQPIVGDRVLCIPDSTGKYIVIASRSKWIIINAISSVTFSLFANCAQASTPYFDFNLIYSIGSVWGGTLTANATGFDFVGTTASDNGFYKDWGVQPDTCARYVDFDLDYTGNTPRPPNTNVIYINGVGGGEVVYNPTPGHYHLDSGSLIRAQIFTAGFSFDTVSTLSITNIVWSR